MQVGDFPAARDRYTIFMSCSPEDTVGRVFPDWRAVPKKPIPWGMNDGIRFEAK